MNAIDAAIDELVRDIGLLQEAVRVLQKVRAMTWPPRAAGLALGAEPKPTPSKAKPERVHRGDWRTGDPKIFDAVRTLREPFDAGMIAKAAGVHRKAAQNFITLKLARGWLARVTRGEYRRTPRYGETASTKSQSILEEIHHEIEATKPKDD